MSSLDIFPTIVALTGIDPPARLDGVDLTSFVNGDNAASPHEALYFSMNAAGAMRQEQWKLVLERNGPPQLFDLSKDVSEKHDLAPTESERVKKMTQKWQAWHAQMPN